MTVTKKQISSMNYHTLVAAEIGQRLYNKDPGVKGTTATVVEDKDDGVWRLSIRDKNGNHLYYW